MDCAKVWTWADVRLGARALIVRSGGICHAKDGSCGGRCGAAVMRGLRAGSDLRNALLRRSGAIGIARSKNPLGPDGCGGSVHPPLEYNSPTDPRPPLLQKARCLLSRGGGNDNPPPFLPQNRKVDA